MPSVFLSAFVLRSSALVMVVFLATVVVTVVFVAVFVICDKKNVNARTH